MTITLLRPIGFIIFLLSLHVQLAAQCDVTVDVPADITICAEDDVDLEGVINGTESCFTWVSDQGYFNDSDTDPTVFVDQNTTFTFTAFGSIPGPNLIVNGDFEGGDDGSFTTDYDLASTSCTINTLGFLQCEGVYEIMNDPSLGHNNFDPCLPMGGLQMVVNGADSDQLIWCQDNIMVTAGKKYQFTAFAQSVNPSSPALLQFSIDGIQIGSILGPPSSTCVWTEITEYWVASTTGPVEICVLNQNTATSGNDFAIDDIFFGELCSDEKEVVVEVGDLSIDPVFPDEFNCSTIDLELALNPDGSFGPFDYDWFNADFNIINDDNNGNAIIFLPGTYIVTVTDQLGCTMEHFFDVEDNITTPDLTLDPIDPILQCDDSFINIFNDGDDPDYEYEWNWEGDYYSNDAILQAADPGFYEVTVTDATNGCTSTANIEVMLDADVPEIEASFSNDIDCNNATSELILQTSDVSTDITWYNEAGDLVTNTTVSVGGFYSVTVVGENGCTADDFFEIPVVDFDPQITIDMPAELNCTNPSTVLTANYNGVLNLDWSGPNSFLSNDNDIVVDLPGTYFLNASDNTGCSVDISIEVLGSFTPPLIELNPFGVLDCDIPSVPISVANYDPSFQYEWTLPNSSILTGPTIDATIAGDYNLLVTASNGCTSQEAISLTPAGNLPILNLAVAEINCTNTQSILEATGTFNSIVWSDSNGIITDLNVTTQGWYYAFADNGGGCDATDSIYLSVDTITPQQNIIAPILNCDGIQDFLYNSLDDNYEYEWTLPDNSTSTQDSLIATMEGTYLVTISDQNGCSAENTIMVSSNVQIPTYSVGGIQPLNCNVSEFELLFSAFSSVESVTLIDPFGVTQDNSLTIQNDGPHVIEIIGSNGCIDSFKFDIEIDTITPTPIVSNTNINCINDIAMLSVDNPAEDQVFLWSNQGTNAEGETFETDQPGLVELVVGDTISGCLTVIEINVANDINPPTLTFDVANLTCVNQEAEIELFPDGEYEYDWILPNLETQSGMTLIAQDTGDYQLFLTGENGCTNDYLINVFGTIQLPEFEVPQPNPINCVDTTTFIEIVSAELLAGYTATYNGSSISFGNGGLTVQNAGEWSVVATASNGCTNTVTFEILLDTISPSPQIQVENINCLNTDGSMTILNPDIESSFEWIDANGGSFFGDSFQPSTEENIMVIETGSNGCIGFDNAMVIIDTITPSLDASSTFINCNNPLSTLEVTDPIDDLEYSWSYNNEIISSQSTFESGEAGIYTIVATNPINNCETTVEIEILAETNIPFSFDFDLERPPCGEEDFFINNIDVQGGYGPYQYAINQSNPIWLPGDLESMLVLGNNFIQIQDSNGCILDTMLNLSLPIPVEADITTDLSINWASDTTLQLSFNKPIDEIESILWTPAIGLSCDDCPSPIVNLTEDQTYEVLVIDKNGCEDIVSIRIEVERFISIYLPNVFTPENQDNKLFFPFSTEQHITNVDYFYIFDRWGNRVFINSNFLPNDPSAGWDGTILGGQAQPGVYTYLLEVLFADGTSQIIAGDVTLVR